MQMIEGHFDGKQVVLDAPVPQGVPANTRVRIFFEETPASSGTSSLSTIADLATAGGLPPDFSQQHEHYVKGSPRR